MLRTMFLLTTSFLLHFTGSTSGREKAGRLPGRWATFADKGTDSRAEFGVALGLSDP